MKDAIKRALKFKEKDKTMKNTLIRILAIMTLATSISAFGLSEKASEAKKTHSSNATTTTSYAQDEPKADRSQDKKRSREQMIQEQNKQWLHDLQGVYGG